MHGQQNIKKKKRVINLRHYQVINFSADKRNSMIQCINTRKRIFNL